MHMICVPSTECKCGPCEEAAVVMAGLVANADDVQRCLMQESFSGTTHRGHPRHRAIHHSGASMCNCAQLCHQAGGLHERLAALPPGANAAAVMTLRQCCAIHNLVPHHAEREASGRDALYGYPCAHEISKDVMGKRHIRCAESILTCGAYSAD